jgi:hypothetical protein
MKKIFFVIIVLLGIITSCTKNFEDFNTDKKHNVAVPGENVFANAQKALSDQIASINVNVNIWKLWVQYWTETTYTDEANYDVVNRTIADVNFRAYYRDILTDLKDAAGIIGATEAVGAEKAIQDNQLAIIDIMEVYTFSELLEIFGNVPYSEANDIDNIYPKYDDALTVYKDLLARLDADISMLDPSTESFGSADLFMGGDVSMWIKFANSLKIRIGITISDADNSTAKAAVESAYANAFAPTEKCELAYIDASNANPIFTDLIQSGRHDFVLANTLVDKMNALEDPRRPAYMAPTDNGDYVGGTYGESSPYAQYSHVADPIAEAAFPNTIIDGIEIAFYLAEAAERGYSVGGTAKEYYEAAITASFLAWGLTEDDAAAYIAKPEVNYSNAASGSTWKEKIGVQAWVAYYLRGLVAYTSWRRLDFPVLNLPPNPSSDDLKIPKRLTYPVNEQTLNPENYAAAASAIGGDKLSTKLFWDKN